MVHRPTLPAQLRRDCQARNFQPQHDADVSQSHFAGQAGEAGALVGAGTGQPEIFVDKDHFPLDQPNWQARSASTYLHK
jgi:hypothetical protein